MYVSDVSAVVVGVGRRGRLKCREIFYVGYPLLQNDVLYERWVLTHGL